VGFVEPGVTGHPHHRRPSTDGRLTLANARLLLGGLPMARGRSQDPIATTDVECVDVGEPERSLSAANTNIA
jgi:hypothetical protein